MSFMTLALSVSACSESSRQHLGLSNTDLSSPNSLSSPTSQPSATEADNDPQGDTTFDEPLVAPDSTVSIEDELAPEIDPPIEQSASGFRPPRITIRTIGACPIVLFDNRNRGRVSCPGLDIRGGSLRGLNLEGGNLRGANLAGADFPSAVTNADLSGANLTGATIRNTNFNGTDLSGATWIDGRVCAEGSREVCR